MCESKDAVCLLDCLAKVFLRCFLMAVVLQLFWLGIILVGSDWAYSIHSSLIDLSRHEFDLINYYGMLFVKICALLFFLLPYISIRLVLRQQKASKK